MVESPPALLPAPIPRPRNQDEYTQYIRKRRHRFQARPYLAGHGRVNLGTFRTHHDARRAIYKFFLGQFKPLPRFVRGVSAEGKVSKYADSAVAFVAEIRTPYLRFRSPPFPTREEAHAAAVAHLNLLVAHVRDLMNPQGDRRQPKRSPAPTAAQLVGLKPAG